MTTHRPSRVRRAAALLLPTLTAGALAACAEPPQAAPPASVAPASPATSGAPAAPGAAPSVPGPPELRMVENDGHRLAFHVTPGGLPAIVLDAGGGEDSSAWDALVPQLARATGSMIITYDRAGLGGSDEVPGLWDVRNAVSDLESGLRQLGLTEGVILVSHSQAGEWDTNVVRTHPDLVAGAVLVDANLPEFFTDARIARILAVNGPQIEALKAQPSTKQTRQLIATAANYGPAHEANHRLTWPAGIPVTVIVSERTPFEDSPDDARKWRDAAAAFARAGPGRTLVTATGSSHAVAKDAPALLLAGIEKAAR